MKLDLKQFSKYVSRWLITWIFFTPIYYALLPGTPIWLAVLVVQFYGACVFYSIDKLLFKEPTLDDVKNHNFIGIDLTKCELFPVLSDIDGLPMNLILPKKIIQVIRKELDIETYFTPMYNSKVQEFLTKNNIQVEEFKFKLDQRFTKEDKDKNKNDISSRLALDKSTGDLTRIAEHASILPEEKRIKPKSVKPNKPKPKKKT